MDRITARKARIVIKLGGSLLMCPKLLLNFQAWFDQQADADYFLVVGGGPIVDGMRKIDEQMNLDQVRVHWSCIALLDATFDIVTQLFSTAVPIVSRLDLNREIDQRRDLGSKQLFIVRVASFYCEADYRDSDRDVSCLPAIGWETTSDTLAMYLANTIDADRVVIIKSCDVEPFCTSASPAVDLEKLKLAVEAGVLDRQVLTYACDLPCSLVRL